MSKETPAIEETSTPQATDVETSPSEADEAETPGGPVKTRPKKVITLTRGQELRGKVKTITKFGAFIDIDLPQDGLVHISELSRGRVEKVEDVLSKGDEVTVWVKNLDRERNRISLTMLKPFDLTYDNIAVDNVYEGEITRIEKYGVFVNIGLEREGLVHVSELSHEFVRVPEDVVSVGDNVNVKVIKVNKRKKQVNLSIKALQEPPEAELPVEETVEDDQETEETRLTTTMAAAFDRFNTDAPEPAADEKPAPERQKSSSRMADVIQRTLQTQQDS